MQVNIEPKISSTVECMVEKFENLKKAINRTGQNMVFAKLVGLSYAQYNKAHSPATYDPVIHDYPLHQTVVNTAVPLINEVITAMNEDVGYPGPRVNEAVHEPKKNGKYRHKYKKLPDGIHPDTTSQLEWAKIIGTNAISIYNLHHAA